MRKTVAIIVGAVLLLATVPAFACEQPPPSPTAPPACVEPFQGWEGTVYVRPAAEFGTYEVRVTQTPSNCVRFSDRFFKRIAKHFIKFGTVAPAADPEVWAVEILSEG